MGERISVHILELGSKSPCREKSSDLCQQHPKVFEKLLRNAIELIKDKDDEHKILFLRSWNEWGEGNHVEPDLKYGKGYLEALKKCLLE